MAWVHFPRDPKIFSILQNKHNIAKRDFLVNTTKTYKKLINKISLSMDSYNKSNNKHTILQN